MSEKTSGLREVGIHDYRGRWYDGAWNDWCWKTPDRWSSLSASNPQAGWTWYWEHHSPWSNQWNSPVDTQWNSTVDTTSSDPRQCGDERDEVIPSFDGTDFRQFETRVRLSCVPYTSGSRETGYEAFEGRAFDLCEEIQDLETPKGVQNLLDYLRVHFEPIDVSRQGKVEDDFVVGLERQPGEEVEEYAPWRDAMPCPRRFLKPVLGKEVYPCVENSQERTLPKWERPGTKEMMKCMSSRQRRLLTTSGRPSTRKQWP